MEKEPLLRSEQKPEEKTENQKKLDYLSEAKEVISNWKKRSDSNLSGEDFRKLFKEDPEKARQLKENKFTKNYFNNITFLLSAARLNLKDSALDNFWSKLDELNFEIANSSLVSESQIDSFDKLALEIIEIIEDIKPSNN